MEVNRNSYLSFEDIRLYGPPNKALANILLSPGMQGIVADRLARVLSVFLSLQAAQPYKDLTRQYRSGGHPPGQLMQETTASVDIGSAAPGLAADRWTGQITVGVGYAGAEFYGRHSYNPYPGNRNLQQALRAVFP